MQNLESAAPGRGVEEFRRAPGRRLCASWGLTPASCQIKSVKSLDRMSASEGQFSLKRAASMKRRLGFEHSCLEPLLAGARAESAPAYQPRATPWESRPLTTLRLPERAQATEATPALAGRVGPLEAGFPGRCPGLMCPHAVGVHNVQAPDRGPEGREEIT